MSNENKKAKILIVEDEQPLVELLTSKLEKEGFEIESANDGEAGFAKMKECNPDLILLDIMMPKMNGYEVLEKMNEERIKIPVVIISNSGQPVEIEKTQKLGAVDHLIKTDFSPLDVLDKVRAHLKIKVDGKKMEERKEEFQPMEGKSDKNLGIKVVLVEDDAFLREICSKKIIKEGYTVYGAIDGEQALKIVNQVKPDIVLLDIILPALDGFQILTQIRASDDEKIAKVPVIMLSNLGQEDDIKKARDMGANDYLVKAHFTTEEIVGKIRETLAK